MKTEYHKQILTWLLLMVSTFYLPSAAAEIYRWTDSEGKVRYSDKKPKLPADDITAAVSKQNLDTSSAEQQKLEAIFRKENDADRAYYAQQQQSSVELEERCQTAKNTLRKLQGRVQFVDDKGQPVNVSERERAKRAEDMRKQIAENCLSL